MHSPELVRFPYLDDMQTLDIGLWAWTRPAPPIGRGRSTRYLDHHVFLEHFDGRWIGANLKDGEYEIGAIWDESPTGAIGRLLRTYGKYAGHINAELTNEEATDRILRFLAVQAAKMHLLAKLSNADYATGALDGWEVALQKIGFPRRR